MAVFLTMQSIKIHHYCRVKHKQLRSIARFTLCDNLKCMRKDRITKRSYLDIHQHFLLAIRIDRGIIIDIVTKWCLILLLMQLENYQQLYSYASWLDNVVVGMASQLSYLLTQLLPELCCEFLVSIKNTAGQILSISLATCLNSVSANDLASQPTVLTLCCSRMSLVEGYRQGLLASASKPVPKVDFFA